MRAGAFARCSTAFLTSGLLGLLATRRRLRRHEDTRLRECAVCRRLQRVRTAVSAVLAVVVLAGSGLWVHHQTTSPTLPGCGTHWVIHSGYQLPGPPADDVGQLAWAHARNILTAPITGIAYTYANARGVELCKARSMTVAFLPSAGTNVGFTVGGMFLTGLPEDKARSIARHESRHVTQWAVLALAGGPLALPVLYGIDDAFFPGSRNHFERAAGLEAGGYPEPKGYGPQPQWSKVAALGLVFLVLTRRHLRWGSRVLTGGLPAAHHSEPGRCPLHSRGWFRFRTQRGSRVSAATNRAAAVPEKRP